MAQDERKRNIRSLDEWNHDKTPLMVSLKRNIRSLASIRSW